MLDCAEEDGCVALLLLELLFLLEELLLLELEPVLVLLGAAVTGSGCT